MALLLQVKELELENEEIRLRNLKRARTEEKLFDGNCVENGDGSADGKVGTSYFNKPVGWGLVHFDLRRAWLISTP